MVVDDLTILLRQSDRAASRLAELSGAARRIVLHTMATALAEQTDTVLAANTLDLEAAREHNPAQSLTALRLTPERVQRLVASLRQWAEQPDPLALVTPIGGQDLLRVRSPLGVLGWVYETYPEWLLAGVSLAVKTANAVAICGTASNTQEAVLACVSEAGYAAGLPEGAILSVPYTDGSGAIALLRQLHYLNLAVLCGRSVWSNALHDHAMVPLLDCSATKQVIYIGANAISATALSRLGKDHEALFVPESLVIVVAAEFPEREQVAALYPDTQIEVVEDANAAIAWCNRHADGAVIAIWSDSWQELQSFRQRVKASLLYINQYPRPDLTASRYSGAAIGTMSLRSPQRGLLLPEHLTTCKYIISS